MRVVVFVHCALVLVHAAFAGQLLSGQPWGHAFHTANGYLALSTRQPRPPSFTL